MAPTETTYRLRNWTGTVHYAINGKPACGPVKTASSWITRTTETVTCEKCLARYGVDHSGTDSNELYVPDPALEARDRRAAERAARIAARSTGS
jgi:hypothetical protein